VIAAERTEECSDLDDACSRFLDCRRNCERIANIEKDVAEIDRL
jgi:hypothetical protein